MPFVTDWRWWWNFLGAQFLMQLLGTWGFESRARRTRGLRHWLLLSWSPVIAQLAVGWKGAILAAFLWFFPFSYIVKWVCVWLMRKVTGYSNDDLDKIAKAELLREKRGQ